MYYFSYGFWVLYQSFKKASPLMLSENSPLVSSDRFIVLHSALKSLIHLKCMLV